MGQIIWSSTIGVAAILATCGAASAAAQPVERIRTGFAAVRSSCPVAISPVNPDGTPATRGESIFGTLGAGFVADLAGEAIGAVAGAIKRASEARAYNLVGTTSFDYFALSHSGLAQDDAVLQPADRCLVLYAPSAQAAPPGVWAAGSNVREQLDVSHDVTLGEMTPGVTDRLPAVYVEALLRHTPDGVRIQPVFFWYREALRGAPTKLSDAELMIEMATPANSDDSPLGETFAFVRIPLPRVAPGTMLRDTALQPHTTIVVPHRPRDGAAEQRLAAVQSLEAATVTRRAEVRAATNALRDARRQLEVQRNAETIEAEASAQVALADAETSLNDATRARDRERDKYGDATPTARATPIALGATNLDFRLVVVREANQFGLAIAAALGEQRDAVEAAVEAGLADEPDWVAGDTANLQAMIDVAAKRRELDAAIAAGDATASRRLRDELLILQARANEAAVTVGRAIPYPGLSVPD